MKPNRDKEKKSTKPIEEKTFTFEEYDRAKYIADKMMKESNGHSYEHILKTRCIFCHRSPNSKGKCGGWFQTFLRCMDLVLLNKEDYL